MSDPDCTIAPMLFLREEPDLPVPALVYRDRDTLLLLRSGLDGVTRQNVILDLLTPQELAALIHQTLNRPIAVLPVKFRQVS